MAKKKHNCWICGAELTDENSWILPEKFEYKPLPYCLDCQGKIYNWVSSNTGYKVAMYACCCMFNVPYFPDAIERTTVYSKGRGAWRGYVVALKSLDLDFRNGKKTEFRDGETEIKRIFKGDMATLMVDDEMLDDEEYRSGKLAQKQMWGDGPEEEPYTSDDYDELTINYNALAEKRQMRSAQEELAIQRVCRWRLQQEKCVERGDFVKAKSIGDMIKAEMEGEQLRKKDEMPADTVRIDDIVLALNKNGVPIPSFKQLSTELQKHADPETTEEPSYRERVYAIIQYLSDKGKSSDAYTELATALGCYISDSETAKPAYKELEDALDDFLYCEKPRSEEYERLANALARHEYEPGTRYPYTYDAADKMLLFIRNATAWNEGRTELPELPEEFSFADDPNGEFAPEQDEAEKQIYKDLQISYDGKPKGGAEDAEP